MVDSLYRPDVAGNGKKLMVDVYERNGNFVTWWNETAPINLTTQFPMHDLDSAGECPFYGLTANIDRKFDPAQ